MTEEIQFIHIGKTGGSFINHALCKTRKVKYSGHKTKLENNGYKYIFCIRDPVKRFVSAYFSRYRSGRPLYNGPQTKNEKFYFEMFKTPNDLAISLTSDDQLIKEHAFKSMKSIGHIKESQTSYLGGINNIELCKDNIFYVGRQETLDQDIINICNKLEIKPINVDENSIKRHKTPEEYNNLKYMSDVANENIKNYYKEDYELIDYLTSIGLLK